MAPFFGSFPFALFDSEAFCVSLVWRFGFELPCLSWNPGAWLPLLSVPEESFSGIITIVFHFRDNLLVSGSSHPGVFIWDGLGVFIWDGLGVFIWDGLGMLIWDGLGVFIWDGLGVFIWDGLGMLIWIGFCLFI